MLRKVHFGVLYTTGSTYLFFHTRFFTQLSAQVNERVGNFYLKGEDLYSKRESSTFSVLFWYRINGSSFLTEAECRSTGRKTHNSKLTVHVGESLCSINWYFCSTFWYTAWKQRKLGPFTSWMSIEGKRETHTSAVSVEFREARARIIGAGSVLFQYFLLYRLIEARSFPIFLYSAQAEYKR